MQILPVDLTALVAVVLGISIVLVPVIGLTARFALKPIVEAMGRSFEHRGLDETVQIMDRRMDLMEQQLEAMDGTVRRLADVAEFHRSLESGKAADDLDEES
jgi:uncharacterized protein (DUF2164 family)